MMERSAPRRQKTSSFTPAKTEAHDLRPADRSPDPFQDALRSPGQPLDSASRAFMEPRFGHDFSRVRVHTDARAAETAGRMNALAFTAGQSIFFGANLYRPETPPGRRLLAHELAHTLQQRAAGSPDPQLFPAPSHPADPLEREADAAAGRVAGGRRLEAGAVSVAATGRRLLISRQMAGLATRDEPAAGPLEAEELVQNLARSIFKNLQLDPEDSSGRSRRQLARLGPATREVVLDRVRARTSPEQWSRLTAILSEPAPPESGALPALEDAPGRAPEPPRPDAETTRPEGPETAPPEPVPATDVAQTATPLGPDAETSPTAATPEAVETSPPAPEEAGTEDVPVPEVRADVPDLAAGAAAPPAPAAVPVPTPAGAGPMPVAAEEGTVEADTGPIEELEAEVQEAEPEEEPAAPEEEAAAPEPGLAEPEAPLETGAGPAPDLGGMPEETAAGEVPEPAEAPLAPEEAGEEEALAEDGEAGGLEASAGDAELGELGADLGSEADTDGEVPTGGGGGGGTPITEQPAPEAPDVSGADPEQALAAVSNLPPARLEVALGGVSAAASRSVGEQRAELAANPPQVERPSGAHAVQESPAAAREAPPVAEGPRQVERAPQGSAAPVPRPAPLPPAPAPPTQAVRPPAVGTTSQGGLSEDDARALRSSLHRLPTHDPALAVTAGPPPTIALEGDADPERAREQRARLDEGVADARARGREDVEQPMGEDGIFPAFEPETLSAEVPAGGQEGAAAPTTGGAPVAEGAGGGDEVAESIVAREQRGEELQAAVSQARAGVAARREEHATQVSEHRATARTDMNELVNSNASQQAQTRTGARTEVQQLRGQWSEGQRDLVQRSQTEADAASRRGEEDVTRERAGAETRAADHIRVGNRQATEARQQAEEQASRERRDAEKDSEGILGWVADRATSFFNAVKNRIQRAFEAARERVRSAIQRAQQLATEAIEGARRAIVGAIRWVGERLVEIGDRLLAGFPALRDRFRAAIRERVAHYEGVVNRLAGALKEGVQRALNLLGTVLNGALNLLERGMLAAVDAAAQTVRGAIQAARSVVQAFAAFAALIRDVAANPGQWVRNLGAAIMDGIRNHLWRALKTAIRNWFGSKVEEVLGLGMAVWRLLTQGGIVLAQVGRMVWEGIKQAIPVVLIQILIQRLVSMIVPAVGAVMVIIEGLQAAWGTVSRIIQAFERFFAFLRAVKTGNAGPQFAEALAAAAVAVIDFVSNWLLSRLRRPAGAIAGRIRAIAQRIGQRLGRIARAAAQGLRRVGQRIRRGMRSLRARGRRMLGRRGTRQQRQARRQRQQQRLDRAVAAIRPPLQQMLRRGTSRTFLWLRLQAWRVRYLLSSLQLRRNGSIVARINPAATASETERLQRQAIGARLEPILAEAEQLFFRRLSEQDETREARIRAAVQRVQSTPEGTREMGENTPLVNLEDLVRTRTEQIEVLRGIYALRPPKRYMRIRFGPGAVIDFNRARIPGQPWPYVRRTSRFTDFFVQPPGTHGMAGTEEILSQVPTPFSGARVRMPPNVTWESATSYPLLQQGFVRLAARFNVPEARLLEALRSPSPAIMEERLTAIRNGLPEADRANFESTIRPHTRVVGLLTQSVEAARAPGMTAATALGHFGARDAEEVLSREGALAPMTPQGATAAVEARAAGRPLTEREQTAEAQRRERIANIFYRIREMVESKDVRVLQGAQGEAAQKLAVAFDQWLNQKAEQTRPGTTPEDLSRNLVLWVAAFLEAYHGEGRR